MAQPIEPGSQVITDGWDGYGGLGMQGYRHEVKVLHGQGKDAARELLPRVHLAASLVKRRLLETHQGAVHPNRLDYYLDEFTFRFNRRNSRWRGKLFYRLLQQAVEIEPAPYRELVGGKSDQLSQPIGGAGVN